VQWSKQVEPAALISTRSLEFCRLTCSVLVNFGPLLNERLTKGLKVGQFMCTD